MPSTRRSLQRIALPYDMLTHDNIRAEASSEPGMTIRLVMNNYFNYDIGRSQRMLQYWEEDKQRMIKLFGPDRYVMLVIDLREILRVTGCSRTAPPAGSIRWERISSIS